MTESGVPLENLDYNHQQIDEWYESQDMVVLLFPNTFDPNEEAQKEYAKRMDVNQARENLIKIYRTSQEEIEKEESLLCKLLHVIPWISKDYEGEQTISKGEFINTVISSVLWTIKNKYKSNYRLFSSRDEDEVFCIMQITEEWCRKRAEITCYKLQFKADPHDDVEEHEFKMVEPWAAYETERLGTVQDSIKFFKRFDLDDNELTGNEDNNRRGGSIFRYSDKARLLLDSMNETFDFNVLAKCGVLLQDFHIHNQKWIDFFSQNWCSARALFKPQPLKKISVYFGEKIALYFAWMNCYMKSMIFAAVAGIIVFILTMVFPTEEKGLNLRNLIPLLFAVFICLWGSVFDQVWVRSEKYYSWYWGTRDFNEEEEQRADFTGDYDYDEVSGKYKKMRQSRLIYKMKKLASYSVVSVFIAIVIVAVGAIMFYRAIDKATYVPILCAVLNAVQIRIMNIIYGWIAGVMTDWENHETESVHSDNLAVKLFFFKFVNSYASLFYIAFAKSFFDEKPEQHNYINELALQLGTIFCINLFLNLIELGMPYLKYRIKIYKENKKVQKMAIDRPDMRLEMGPIEEQAKLAEYESPMDDYMEMVLQYGYVVLFCAAFPLTPLLALIELIIEIKVDAWKLCKLTLRPRPYRAEDIGVWRSVVLTISFIAAFTNAALIIFASPAFIELQGNDKLMLFFAIEHGLLFLKFAIGVIIPDDPQVVNEGYTWGKRIVKEKLYNKVASGQTGGGIRHTKSFEENVSEKRREGFRITPNDIRYVEDSS